MRRTAQTFQGERGKLSSPKARQPAAARPMVSIQQAIELLAQPAQDPALADVSRALADPQLRRDLRPGSPGYYLLPTSFPSGRLELGLHQAQGAARQVVLVLRFFQH